MAEAVGEGRQEGGTRENSAAGSTVDVSEETPTHQLLHGEKIVAYARKQPTPTAYHGVSAVSGAEQVLLVSIVDADAPIPFVDENRKMRRCFNVDTDKCGNVSVGAFTKEYLNDGGKLTPAQQQQQQQQQNPDRPSDGDESPVHQQEKA